ncbi:MAG TPA: formate dehydrogenase accessory sulfurtransferase FdhD [Peptococcaceae bacterium]|nr:formate dehydrogenase accessory sulfurtransferase FdhD [Peptococcaceae bacterium]
MELITEKRFIYKINEAGRQRIGDILLREATYRFLVNGQAITNFNCTPENVRQLALGYAFSQGLFSDLRNIENLQIDEDNKEIYLTIKPQEKVAEPEIETADSKKEIILTVAEIHALNEEFTRRCNLYRLTGASHSCALATRDGIIIYMDDVARHNALNKVIGEMLLQEIQPAHKVFIFSGRLALDMIEKAGKVGVKILIAPGAPTLAAVELAESLGLTLLGFVRPGNINIYTHWQRIK